MPPPEAARPIRQQRGAALLLVALAVFLFGLGFILSRMQGSPRAERSAVTDTALSTAKAALIGYAITYREKHPNEVFGYLPCPDTDNNGEAEASCGTTDESMVGRLPWKTLGLPPPRDGAGECLWYAVSGRAKNDPKTAAYNWDTIGQFIVRDPDANTLAGSSAYDQPVALILAPGSVIAGQSRIPSGTSECGGSNNVADYLEGIGAAVGGITTVVLANAASINAGTNNDRGLWLFSRDIFDPIKRRSDFKTDIDTMMNDVANFLNAQTPASLPASAASGKGVGAAGISATLAKSYLDFAVTEKSRNLFINWMDNLLYTKPGGTSTVTAGIAESGCYAVLMFAGERATGQSRDPAIGQRDDKNQYLEGSNAALFPSAGFYSGASGGFSASAGSADLARCIKGLTPPAVQVSFAADFPSLVTSGAPTAVAENPDQTVTLLDASGTTGGCFWFANAIPLAGRIVRAYYTFQFSAADAYALGSAADTADNGYGFTLQMVQGNQGVPDYCGREYNNGALTGALGDFPPGPFSGFIWGNPSFLVETDVRRSAARNDPIENHTAIMINGITDHGLFGTLGTSCNGTTTGCRHAPANKFEESPAPLSHNQRIEIHTGCNIGCTVCSPASHAAPTTYARISVWVDCSDCSSTTSDLNRTTTPPNIQSCQDLNVTMNTVYVGFTGGFRSDESASSVTIRDFVLRSE